jgi:hypothetical protein
MNNQEINNPYDYGRKDDGKKYGYDDDKDCKYDDELGDVPKDYACEDISMSLKSKKS